MSGMGVSSVLYKSSRGSVWKPREVCGVCAPPLLGVATGLARMSGEPLESAMDEGAVGEEVVEMEKDDGVDGGMMEESSEGPGYGLLGDGDVDGAAEREESMQENSAREETTFPQESGGDSSERSSERVTPSKRKRVTIVSRSKSVAEREFYCKNVQVEAGEPGACPSPSHEFAGVTPSAKAFAERTGMVPGMKGWGALESVASIGGVGSTASVSESGREEGDVGSGLDGSGVDGEGRDDGQAELGDGEAPLTQSHSLLQRRLSKSLLSVPDGLVDDGQLADEVEAAYNSVVLQTGAAKDTGHHSGTTPTRVFAGKTPGGMAFSADVRAEMEEMSDKEEGDDEGVCEQAQVVEKDQGSVMEETGEGAAEVVGSGGSVHGSPVEQEAIVAEEAVVAEKDAEAAGTDATAAMESDNHVETNEVHAASPSDGADTPTKGRKVILSVDVGNTVDNDEEGADAFEEALVKLDEQEAQAGSPGEHDANKDGEGYTPHQGGDGHNAVDKMAETDGTKEGGGMGDTALRHRARMPLQRRWSRAEILNADDVETPSQATFGLTGIAALAAAKFAAAGRTHVAAREAAAAEAGTARTAAALKGFLRKNRAMKQSMSSPGISAHRPSSPAVVSSPSVADVRGRVTVPSDGVAQDPLKVALMMLDELELYRASCEYVIVLRWTFYPSSFLVSWPLLLCLCALCDICVRVV